MARQRKEKKAPQGIELKQPDRSGPSEQTLLQIAQDRQLFREADRRQRQISSDPPTLSPGAERFLEAALWTATMAMVHFSFDVLVYNQYGTEIAWPKLYVRTARAWLVFLVLFYPLHPHTPDAVLVPGLPQKYQRPLRQAIFCTMSILAGCYLIHISNTYGYLAVMKQAPPLGCLWLWAVVELDLVLATISLAVAAVFVWQGGYDFK